MRHLLTVLTGLLLTAGVAQAAPSDFPRPDGLKPAVQFWTRVYTRVATDGGLLHDRDNLSVVYEKIDLDSKRRRARSRQVRARKDHYRKVLRAIARKHRTNLDAEEKRVLALWPDGVSDGRLQKAAYNIRFQLGQSDKFRAGLIRSGAWEPHIQRTLKRMGLPKELAALPHVESSFNPDAWSRVGAAGLWQFTRATGRRYMRIDGVIDERMDPFKSSESAARLLEHNYSITDNWALAITAYNHGLAGIRRAAKRVGTDNIATIVDEYSSPTWGFASRNFYAAFLAAVTVDFHPKRYFGDLDRNDALASETIELPFFAKVSTLTQAFDVDRAHLRRLNRALRDPVWDGDKRVPRGYKLRLPTGPKRPAAAKMLARIKPEARFYAQIPDRKHRVRRGETVSTIAARYDVSPRAIVSLNNLKSRNFIRVGQVLRLPLAGGIRDGQTFYTVSRGDTLSGIAQRVGLRLADLRVANGLDPGDAILPGQKLRVDGRAAEDVQTTVAQAETGAAASTTATNETAESGTASESTEPETEPTSAVEDETGDETETATDHEQADAEADADDTGTMTTLDTATGEEKTEDGTQPALSADPADYSVAADGSIEVQAAETLGHYAEWLDLRAKELRRINDMRYGKPVIVGNRLQLRFNHVTPARFEQRREDYHERLQARFFKRFHITGTRRALVKAGDSLWILAGRAEHVPVWLLRQYNPDLDFANLHPGMRFTLPIVERQPNADDDSTTQAEGDTESSSGET